jgi:hypothetical protein
MIIPGIAIFALINNKSMVNTTFAKKIQKKANPAKAGNTILSGGRYGATIAITNSSRRGRARMNRNVASSFFISLQIVAASESFPPKHPNTGLLSLEI